MADEVSVGRELPSFVNSVLDKTECICQGNVGVGTAETHAEVIDQSIRMLIVVILEQVTKRSWINL